MAQETSKGGINASDKVFSERLESYKAMPAQNKRRKALGVQINCWEDNPSSFFGEKNSRYLRGSSSVPCSELLRSFLGDEHIERSDRMKLLRRSKMFLSRRKFADLSEDSIPSLYGVKGKIETVLDCFPSLKYSYSAPLPPRVIMRKHGISDRLSRFCDHVRFLDVCCSPDGSSKKARLNDLSRSSNLRLDPMDAPRQLFIYRCRIRRCLSWGYSVGLVPIMMTLTIFHRWHPLKKLLWVISKAWNHFFTAGYPATERSKRMGVQAYIRRLEETINNGSRESGYNSGWHPHYHVILFVPRDKVSVVSEMEDELREAWFRSVSRYFKEAFGEEIDSSYADSFKKHGLVFSRYGYDDDNYSLSLSDNLTFDKRILTYSNASVFSALGETSSRRAISRDLYFDDSQEPPRKRPLRPVDDSEYVSKIVGCDPCFLYTGDSEMTSIHSKSSRIPFDLLCDDTAENNDLWVEYALATKGVRCFIFSRHLEDRVREYFDAHPEKDSVKSFVKSDKVVAQLDSEIYHLVYQNFKVDEMLRVAVKGYEALCEWFRSFYIGLGFFEKDITDDMLPLPPHTCSPFGDRVDVLSFFEKSNTAPPATLLQSTSGATSALPHSVCVTTSAEFSSRPVQLELQFDSSDTAETSASLPSVQISDELSPRQNFVSDTRTSIDESLVEPATSVTSSQKEVNGVGLTDGIVKEELVALDGRTYRQILAELLEEPVRQALESGVHISEETFELVACALLEEIVLDEQRARAAVEEQGLDEKEKAEVLRDLSEQLALEREDKAIQARVDEVSKSKWYPSWYRAYLNLLKDRNTRLSADYALRDKITADRNKEFDEKFYIKS